MDYQILKSIFIPVKFHEVIAASERPYTPVKPLTVFQVAVHRRDFISSFAWE